MKTVVFDPGAEARAFSIKAQKEPIGTIGIPVRDHLSSATVISLITTALSPGLLDIGANLDFNVVQGSVLTLQRNELIQRMRGDWLLFIDDDMVWQPAHLRALLETQKKHDLDIVGGLCFRRAAPHEPTMFMREAPTSGSYNYLERWEPGEIVEVDATGMAFCLIHRRVFERIVAKANDLPFWSMPKFEDRVGKRPPNFFRWEGGFGEDLRFCQDARAAGCRIFVDTNIEIGHLAEVEIRHRDFLREVAERNAEMEAARREVNDAMGLPTLTREEARRDLGW